MIRRSICWFSLPPSQSAASGSVVQTSAQLREALQGTTSAPVALSLSMSLCRSFAERDRDTTFRIVEAYRGFWDHIRFRKGWATPPFQFEDVRESFQESAEYVVRIRRHLDSVNPGMKMRMLDGTAQTYLQQATKDDAMDHIAFVRRLVHATLQDAKGYVEGLTKETVDEMMKELMRHRHSPKVSLEYSLREMADIVRDSKVDDGHERWVEGWKLGKTLHKVIDPTS